MSPKLLLIILDVLIALFFGSTGRGLLSNDDSVGAVTEAVMSMVRGLHTSDSLLPDDVANATPANCLDQLRQGQFVLASGGRCEFAVGASSAPVRTLTVRLQEGGADGDGRG